MIRLVRALVFVAVFGMPGAVGAAELKPHIATYKPALSGAPAGIEVDGQIFMSNMLRCKAWTFNQSSSISIQAQGKRMVSLVLIQQGEESIDGKSMNFTSQMAVNGQRMEIKDTGTASGRGKSGKVDVEQGGAKKTIDLPDGAYFPAGATEKMIDELTAGKKSFSIKMFDPARAHDVVEQNYTISDSPFSTASLPADPGGLLAGPSWIVKSVTSVNGQPSEVFYQMHRSGVASRIMQNVGGIKIEFTIETLQAMPAMGC